MRDAPQMHVDLPSPGRLRFTARLNTVLALALAAVLVGMLNYLSYRHYLRVDLTRSRFYALSEKTLQLLHALPADVAIYVLFSPDHPAYEDIANLLKEYAYHGQRVQVEYVDPHRQLARAEELSSRYNLAEAAVVLFVCEDRTRTLSDRDLVRQVYDERSLSTAPASTLFLGEVAFSSAIKAVAEGDRPVVYALGGHGERGLDDFDAYRGYSDIAEAMRRDNMDLRPFVFGERRAVPADADALLIAGPTRKLSQPEVDLVARYLEQNGRVMILLDHRQDTGLEPLLEDWGLRAGNGLAVDGTRSLKGMRGLWVTSYKPHPITQALQGGDEKMTTIYHLPRPIEPVAVDRAKAAGADRLRVTPLVTTSDAGWAETDLDQQPMRFDPGVDRPGPIAIAAAVERGAEPGIDTQLPPARLVVFGDSDFASNGALTGGNPDLFLSAMNWLLEREELMAIDAKPVEMYRLVLSERQMWAIFWLAVAGLPAAVALLGIFVWAGRRAS